MNSIPLQVPGGPELLVILLIVLIPVALLGGVVLLFRRRRGRLAELESRVEELEAERRER